MCDFQPADSGMLNLLVHTFKSTTVPWPVLSSNAHQSPPPQFLGIVQLLHQKLPGHHSIVCHVHVEIFPFSVIEGEFPTTISISNIIVGSSHHHDASSAVMPL